MQKKIPMRQCVGCREMRQKKELVRVVKSPEGVISLDFRGKAPGRGAYLCPNSECLKKAIRAKALERAFDTRIPQEILDELVRTMEEQQGAQARDRRGALRHCLPQRKSKAASHRARRGRPHIPPRKILLPGGKAPVPVRAVHEGRAGGRTGLQRLRAVRNSGRAVCKGVSGGPAGAGAAA